MVKSSLFLLCLIPLFWSCLSESQIQDPAPEPIFEVVDLKDPDNQFEMIIIAGTQYHDALVPLVAQREQEGIKSVVTTPTQIEQLFSQGQSLPNQIQLLVQEGLNRWQEPNPQYLLLVGSAEEIPFFEFESRFSGNATVDEDSIGLDWPYAINLEENDDLPDIAVGRLPLSNVSHIEAYVEKALSFSTSSPANRLISISDYDTLNQNLFEQLNAQFLQENVNITPQKRIDIRSDSPFAVNRDQLIDIVNQGTQYIHFFGLSTNESWSKDRFFTTSDLPRIQNNAKPFFLHQFQQQGIEIPQLLESLLSLEKSGAIGIIQPIGANYAFGTNEFIHTSFGNMVSGNYLRFGDAFLNAQKRHFLPDFIDSDARRFHYYGDPSLPIPSP